MKTSVILCAFAFFAALAGAALATPDSLRCRLVDWLDAPGISFFYGPFDVGNYWYSGIYSFDLAMGDSFLVWLPGTQRALFVDVTNQTEIETTYCPFYGSENVCGAEVLDTIIYLAGGALIWDLNYTEDTTYGIDYYLDAWANFHYAVTEDTFLYTVNMSGGIMTCLNIADPESLFVYRTDGYIYGQNGLEAMNGFAYCSGTDIETISDEWYPLVKRPYWYIGRIDMVNSGTSEPDTTYRYWNRFGGSITRNDSLVFYVNTEMDDYDENIDDTVFTIGYSYLGVWERDYSYRFDSLYGLMPLGIGAISDNFLVIGFDHGFRILNVENLTDICEVAYYWDEDSLMAFTHYALKGNKLYAMGHPRGGYARLYLFELSDSIFDYQCELEKTPEDFKLYQYPNPFNSSCRLAFNSDRLYKKSSIEIFDIAGRRVFNNSFIAYPGQNNIIWSPEDLSSGIYFARVFLDDIVLTAKLVFIA